MYVLDFLSELKSQSMDDQATFEYRLLCSGELYNGKVMTGDWRKSDATRSLLRSPFNLCVCSHPFDDYPQEIAMDFKIALSTRQRENVSFTSYFDHKVAQDLAALLSLFCRRLITVAAKVRVVCHRSVQEEQHADVPLGFLNSVNISNWKRHPTTVIYGAKGVEQIIDYNPPPLPVDPEHLQRLFTAVPDLPQKESFILSVRLYALALESLISDVDIAYQFLIASIEAIANEIFKTYSPDREEMLKTKKSVQKLAIKFGLSEKLAEELALEACKGIPWSNRKFIKFILDYTDDKLWTEDDLFKELPLFLPKRDGFESALRQIYSMRGKATHGGHPYPLSTRIGIGPLMPAWVMLEIGGTVGSDNTKPVFPPVTWFERVVNMALCGFLEKSKIYRSLLSPDVSGNS
jgi:hypothetical protein